MKTLLVFLLLTTSVHAQEYRSPNNFHEHTIVEHDGIIVTSAMKGAVPGFAKKPRYFNAKKAEEQLRYLYNEKGVRLVISLDHCENIRKVINKINEKYEGVDLEHVCRKIVRSDKKRYRDSNIKLFEEVAFAIENIPFYIHCRYGAHRAVTALTGGWIASKKLSFDEAFKRAGGKTRAFRSKGQQGLLNHAKRYSKDLRKE
tara:strand:+ start:1060 stop:1662 length:603 start_codon:yes stop_codon:yes gene_type:complete